jgi:hypothetical protein
MVDKRKTKCLFCGEIFIVDVRNRGRQKYCSKPACRAAGKAARQRRWREKPQNRDYFRGPVHVGRVRDWRAAHPGYWRSHRRRKRPALQDALILQTVERPSDSAGFALQDGQSPLGAQDPVLIGLIAQLTDSTLQDAIAVTVRRLLQLGQDILTGADHDDPQTGAAP